MAKRKTKTSTVKTLQKRYKIPDADIAVELAHIQAAEMLRHARINARLTQTQLANRLDVSQSEISQAENPNVRSTSLKTLARYASALGKRLEIRLK